MKVPYIDDCFMQPGSFILILGGAAALVVNFVRKYYSQLFTVGTDSYLISPNSKLILGCHHFYYSYIEIHTMN